MKNPERMTNSSKQNLAFTALELLVVVATLGLLALTVIPALARTGPSTQRLFCVNDLKQIGLAFQNWRNSHVGVYPMNVLNRLGGPPVGVSTLTSLTTSGGFGAAPYLYAGFGVMSNELSTPKLLVCPSDERSSFPSFVMHYTTTTIPQQVTASSSGTPSDNDPSYFNNFKISYFLGVNVSDLHPQMFLAGDRNIWGDHTGSTTQPTWNLNGYGNLAGTQYWMGTNWSAGATFPAWSPSKMHQGRGNVLLADGSVQQLDSAHLRQLLAATGDTTLTPGPNTLLFP